MNKKDYITIFLISLFSGATFYLDGFLGIFGFLFSISFYTALFYMFHILWSKIRKREIIDSLEYIKKFIHRISILIIVTVFIIGSLSYISNEIFPAKMPQYTITNGEKEVVFQAMIHIGSDDYYNSVINDLKSYKEEGGVYFFEGVKGGTIESEEKFNKALGINFDSTLYENFSKLYGISHQDTSKFLGLVNDNDFNIDLNIDEIIKIYEEKTKDLDKTYEEPIDVNTQITNSIVSLNDKELKILVYINQAILNRMVGSKSFQELINNNFANKELFDVILNERNKVLSKEIIESDFDKIFITYGLLHFQGVFDLLKQNDEKWKIVETKYYYPIK